MHVGNHVSMYVCIYIRTYDTYECMYVYVLYDCMYVHPYVYRYVYMFYVCMYVGRYVCMYRFVVAYVHTRVYRLDM